MKQVACATFPSSVGRVEEEERELSGLQTAYKRHHTDFTIQTRVKPQTDMAAEGWLAFLLVVLNLGNLGKLRRHFYFPFSYWGKVRRHFKYNEVVWADKQIVEMVK